MKTICEKDKLLKALSITNRLTSNKVGLPILQNIYFSAQTDKLIVKATNLDTTIECSLDAKVETAGDITVPSKLLLDFLYNNTDEMITISSQDTNLKITSSKHKASLKGMAPEDYPSLPSIDFSRSVKLSSKVVNDAIGYTGFASSIDETRPVLTGVLWRFEKDKISVVGTDGFRLSLYTLEYKSDFEGDYIIPKKSLAEVQRIIEGGEVEIVFSASQVMFKTDGVSLISRLVEGNFPNYAAIIPAKKEIQVMVDSGALLKNLKIASVFSRDTSFTTTLLLNNGNLEINAISAIYGDTNNNIKVEGDQDKEFKISLNAQYLIDILSVINGKVVLDFIDSKSPVVVSLPGSHELTYLVMPLRTE